MLFSFCSLQGIWVWYNTLLELKETEKHKKATVFTQEYAWVTPTFKEIQGYFQARDFFFNIHEEDQ